MEVKIKRLPYLHDYGRMYVFENYIFLQEILDAIHKANNEEELQKGMYLLFAQKLENPNLIFNYGWDKKGLIVYYEDRAHRNNETCLECECNTDFIQEE